MRLGIETLGGNTLLDSTKSGIGDQTVCGAADLDWRNLTFGYTRTDFNIRYRFADGRWDEGRLTREEFLPIHIAATCLHYGQECFEGLKVFQTKSGQVAAFRMDRNAARMQRSCRKILMEPPPTSLFMEAVERVVKANLQYVPPYGTGASLYVRPLMIGVGPQVGVHSANEYLFVVFVTPVGPYFKEGFKPVRLVVEENVDRAAPQGVGDAKVGGNYAAGLRASMAAKACGYTEVLYLDPREKRYIDESGPANFFAITKEGQYITPESPSILPSITNDSLITLGESLGLNPQRRRIAIEEIFDFAEAGCCGTAAVLTPIGAITYRDRTVEYCPDNTPGPICTKLYQRLTAIQWGEAPDEYGWLFPIA